MKSDDRASSWRSRGRRVYAIVWANREKEERRVNVSVIAAVGAFFGALIFGGDLDRQLNHGTLALIFACEITFVFLTAWLLLLAYSTENQKKGDWWFLAAILLVVVFFAFRIGKSTPLHVAGGADADPEETTLYVLTFMSHTFALWSLGWLLRRAWQHSLPPERTGRENWLPPERGGRAIELGPLVHKGALTFTHLKQESDACPMMLISAGEFVMGRVRPGWDMAWHDMEGRSLEEYENENWQHVVYLDEYWIDQHPVTVARYRHFCQATGRTMPSSPSWGWIDDHPIVNVSWDDAADYCEWAGVCLPTEAEWEKAARGTDGRKYPWGNDWEASKCNNSASGPGQTTPVGSYPDGASLYGAHDMAGNVWEWCADWYGYIMYPAHNPTGAASGTKRVLRGGAWSFCDPDGFSAPFRSWNTPNDRSNDVGFRCAQGRERK